MVYTLVVHFRVKDDESIAKVKDKLVEASQVYSQDKETVSWFIMQSVFDKRDFSELGPPHYNLPTLKSSCGHHARAIYISKMSLADPSSNTAIVERYENEKSQKYHLENPYWKTFDPYVKVSVIFLSMDSSAPHSRLILTLIAASPRRRHGSQTV